MENLSYGLAAKKRLFLKKLFLNEDMIWSNYCVKPGPSFVNLTSGYPASGTRGPDGGCPPDIRDVTDGICKLRKTYNNRK